MRIPAHLLKDHKPRLEALRATKPASAGSPLQPTPLTINRSVARPQPAQAGFVGQLPSRRGFTRRPRLRPIRPMLYCAA
jgi:hypothetical protein